VHYTAIDLNIPCRSKQKLVSGPLRNDSVMGFHQNRDTYYSA